MVIGALTKSRCRSSKINERKVRERKMVWNSENLSWRKLGTQLRGDTHQKTDTRESQIIPRIEVRLLSMGR